MADPHIGELAELYAVGALDRDERAQVEAHVATCAVCLRRVGEAEETLLALEAGAIAQTPPRRRELKLRNGESRVRTVLRLIAAVAAGIVIGVLATFSAYRHAQDTQPALVAMVQSHFLHAQFMPAGNGTAPAAKAIYARDRSWVFIIARGTEDYAVFAVGQSSARSLGVLHPSGSTSTLFVDSRVAEPSIELREGARVVERAALR
jgi:anti-sigma factor RsiW